MYSVFPPLFQISSLEELLFDLQAKTLPLYKHLTTLTAEAELSRYDWIKLSYINTWSGMLVDASTSDVVNPKIFQKIEKAIAQDASPVHKLILRHGPNSVYKSLSAYIAWQCYKNNADALFNKNFLTLFNKKKPFNNSYAEDSPILIAAIFCAKKVILNGVARKLFDVEDLCKAMCIAITCREINLLNFLIKLAKFFQMDLSLLCNFRYGFLAGLDVIHFAIKEKFAEGLQLLLNKNIRPQEEESEPMDSYIHLAIRLTQDPTIVQILISAGFNSSIKCLGKTPLDLAIKLGLTEIVELLWSAESSCTVNLVK